MTDQPAREARETRESREMRDLRGARDARPREEPEAAGRGEEIPLGYAGPLPSPEILKGYEAVLEGSAERIMQMIQDQAEHRMRLETSLVDGAVRTERLGQIFGLAVVLLAFAASAWLIDTGHSVSGTILGVADLAALALVFARRGAGSEGG